MRTVTGTVDRQPNPGDVVSKPRQEESIDAVLEEILEPHPLAGGQWTDGNPGEVGK